MKSLNSRLTLWIALKSFSSLKSKLIFSISRNKVKSKYPFTFTATNAVLRNCFIEVHGKNCSISVGENTRLLNCKIQIFGDNCKIKVGADNKLNHAWLWLEDKNSNIEIGKRNDFTGKIQLAAIEGTAIKIGNDCLFSRNIQVSTGDSHSIIEMKTNQRINPSMDIEISNHVWIGMSTTICKGVKIGKDSIVGRGSIVTHSFMEGNISIAGIPAKIVRSGIDWKYERV